MSGDRPFAVVDPGDDDEGEMPTLNFGGICEMGMGHDDSYAESVADFTKYAAKINAAVAARERKAAAQALRALADFAAMDLRHLSSNDVLRHPAAEAALGYVEREARTRAEQVEKGEA